MTRRTGVAAICKVLICGLGLSAVATACAVDTQTLAEEVAHNGEETATTQQALGATTVVADLSGARFVSYDASNAYYTIAGGELCSGEGPASVNKVRLSTGARSTLASLDCRSPAETASDGATVFFSEWAVDDIRKVGVGGGAHVLFAGTSSIITKRGLKVDSSNVYWADSAGIRRKAKVGGATVTLAPCDGPCELLAIDATHAYYQRSDVGSGWRELHRVPLAGGASRQINRDVRDFTGLVVTADRVYWAANGWGSEGNYGIFGTPKAGGILSLYHNGPGYVTSLAINGSHLYWSEAEFGSFTGAGTIKRRPVGNGQTITVKSALSGARDLHLSSTHLYWVEGLSSTLKKATLP